MISKRACALAVVTTVLSLGLLLPGWAAPKEKKVAPADVVIDEAPAPADEDDAAKPTSPQLAANQMLGTYVGQFGSHRITICLQNVVGDSINGYSVVAGNARAFVGSIVPNGAAWELHAREPGDHAQDGAYVFIYKAVEKHLTGTWTPNDKKLRSYTFDLPRRKFKYDPKLGNYPQASTRALKTVDVENLPADKLRIMRNEIYARHGYTFRLKEVRDHFDAQDWYMPISFNVSTQLTDVEQRNETLIKKYEKYGAEYYDAFGR